MKTYTFESRVAHVWASFETIIHTVTAPSQEVAYSIAKMHAEQTACPDSENATFPQPVRKELLKCICISEGAEELTTKGEKAGKCKETPDMF